MFPQHLTISPSANVASYKGWVEQHGSPLQLIDLNQLQAQYKSLQQALPDVGFFYAVKAFPQPDIIRKLVELGSGFDIATSGEIELIQPLGANPRKTIHTHPIKQDQDIRAALRYGCTTFVVDNPLELEKFVPHRNRVGLLLRISFRAPDALVDLSKKFGCQVGEAETLIAKAKELNLHIKGFSFHVGSQCKNGRHHALAIRECIRLFESVNNHDGVPLSVLDIGGGFPVPYIAETMPVDEFCVPIREVLQELPDNIQVIAEPGRYLVAPAVRTVATVMGKAVRGEQVWYYLDDGLYGSFSGQLFDHVTYPLEIFADEVDQEKRFPSVLAGPTCDSIDVIAEDLQLPELGIGDLIVGHQMGAYSAATATDFNLFGRAKAVLV